MTSPLTGGHTVHGYDGELNQLHQLVIKMAQTALEQSRNAVQALGQRDSNTANQVVKNESFIDDMENSIDEKIVEIIARRAPKASDLRTLMAFSKVLIDLERIGDEAAKVASITLELSNDGEDANKALLQKVFELGNQATTLLEQAIKALDEIDSPAAQTLTCQSDKLMNEFSKTLKEISTSSTDNIGQTVNTVLILKALGRIGDHARNITEYVIYIANGVNIRHLDHSALCPTDI